MLFQAENYKGDSWGNQGPKLVSAMIKETCPVKNGAVNASMTERECAGFTILPERAAYPLPFTDWWKLYHAEEAAIVSEALNGSFALHYWSSMDMLYKKDPRVIEADFPIYQIFAENCPITEENGLRPLIGTVF